MARSNPRRAAAGGFTLVELLVVVAIMVLVASMAVISVGPMLRGHALRSAARNVQALLCQARTYAATHNTYTALSIGVPDGPIELHVYFSSDTFDADVVNLSNRLLVEGTKTQAYLPTGIRFVHDLPVVGGSSPRNTVAFAPTGCLDAAEMGIANRRIYVVASATQQVDNDLDGQINEDWRDGQNNDGDGQTDEDPPEQAKLIEIVFASGMAQVRDE